MLTLEELKAKIAANYDECALVDRLGLTTTDLVERFEDVIQDMFDEFYIEILKEEPELVEWPD